MTRARGLQRLSRAHLGLPAVATVRLVQLGLGNFHRAHQAWYTANAADASGWGIAAFTGRRPDVAEQLAPQDGLYTLITRSADGDSFKVIGSLVAVHPSTDRAAYLNYLRQPEVAVVTITVTEAGYVRSPHVAMPVPQGCGRGRVLGAARRGGRRIQTHLSEQLSAPANLRGEGSAADRPPRTGGRSHVTSIVTRNSVDWR